MSLFNLGYKQRLLLVVVITLVGIAALVALSVVSLSQQSQASREVDRISRSSLALSQFKVDILSTALRDGSQVDALARYNRLLSDKQAVLDQLAGSGVEQTDALKKALLSWVLTQKDYVNVDKQIGATRDQGQRGKLQARMAELEKTMFSNMRSPFKALSSSIDAMVEQRDAASMAAYDKRIAEFRSFLNDLGFLDAFSDRLNAIKAEGDKLEDLLRREQRDQATGEQQLDALTRLADTRILAMMHDLERARSHADATGRDIRFTLLISGVLVALVSAGLLLFTWRTSTRSLSTAVTTLERIAEGDLRQQMAVNARRNDEFDRLGLAVNNLTEQLGTLLNSVIASSHNLQSRSAELTGTLQNLVQESAQTEGETSSVAAAVEEISMTAQDMAAASEETRQLSLSATAATEKGGAVITDALGSLELLTRIFDQIHNQLNDLGEASARVDGVTDMINGLAGQTNLLALNAAIEAARAGDAGRGFSVVADEVRALAEKTVTATGNINQIVTDMQSQLKLILQSMSEGQTQVEGSRRLGDSAVGEISQIRDLFTQVSDRNQQQAASVEQISATTQAIASSMSGVLDNVSRSAERSREISSFSGQVVDNTNELLGMTSRFRC